jgi:hypothetical protein
MRASFIGQPPRSAAEDQDFKLHSLWHEMFLVGNNSDRNFTSKQFSNTILLRKYFEAEKKTFISWYNVN